MAQARPLKTPAWFCLSHFRIPSPEKNSPGKNTSPGSLESQRPLADAKAMYNNSILLYNLRYTESYRDTLMNKKDLPKAKHKVNGYHYCPLIEDKDDIYSVTHYVMSETTGKVTSADFSPYIIMSLIDFETYVALGLPKRTVNYRPLGPADLRRWKGNLKVRDI